MKAIKPLEFDTYSEVRMPMGFCLFFPKLAEEQRNPRHARKSELERVMIVAADARDRRILSGVAIRSVLHVDLERKRFFELIHELEKRDLQTNPIRFDFELDEGGQLMKLRLDDETIERSLGTDSEISELQTA